MLAAARDRCSTSNTKSVIRAKAQRTPSNGSLAG
jgi:hypothetical protein